jgi:anti-sigma-K factor RskA
MNHDEAYELLAPLALDALDDGVRHRVEGHVAACPTCQAELDGLREVASALGTTYEAPPADLWDRIADRLYEREGAEAATPDLALVALVAPSATASFVSGVTELTSSRSRRTRAIVASVALAAAAAIIVLSVNLASANNQVANLHNALRRASQGAVLAALSTPGHKVVILSGATGRDVAKFVVLPDGRGYLVSADMTPLAKSETYQLWGIVNGKPVSVGVMGPSPSHVVFTLASSPAPSALAVTVEPAGGSLTPAKSAVASGLV